VTGMSATTVIVNQQQKEQNKQHATPSIDLTEIFKSISDDKSLTLFNSVAHMNEKSELLISKLGMTRKQFYARMGRLLQQGLLARKGGQYHLTMMGKIIYHLQNTIGKAAEINQWKLRTLDTLVGEHCMPSNELHILVDKLIENDELRTLVHQTLRLDP
jgi:hypothetical protein